MALFHNLPFLDFAKCLSFRPSLGAAGVIFQVSSNRKHGMSKIFNSFNLEAPHIGVDIYHIIRMY